MLARGRVQNGVVVLDEGAHFPEGQDVIVLGPATVPTAPPSSSLATHSILDIPAVSLGSVLPSLTADEDLLGEMLDGRP